jgi:hypothetical protein
VGQLQDELMAQPGIIAERPASLLFQRWLQTAEGGSMADEDADDSDMIPSLELFEKQDDGQMQALMRRLAFSGLVINHYLLEVSLIVGYVPYVT